MVQLLRLHVFTVGGVGSTPGQGTRRCMSLYAAKNHIITNKQIVNLEGTVACPQANNQGLLRLVGSRAVSLSSTGRGPVLACADRGACGQGALSFQGLVSISLSAAPSWVAWSPPGWAGAQWVQRRARTREQGGRKSHS